VVQDFIIQDKCKKECRHPDKCNEERLKKLFQPRLAKHFSVSAQNRVENQPKQWDKHKTLNEPFIHINHHMIAEFVAFYIRFSIVKEDAPRASGGQKVKQNVFESLELPVH
jgi:hypothetical protein